MTYRPPPHPEPSRAAEYEALGDDRLERLAIILDGCTRLMPSGAVVVGISQAEAERIADECMAKARKDRAAKNRTEGA